MGIRFKFVAKILFLCLKTIKKKKKVSEIHILIFLLLIRYVSDNVESLNMYTNLIFGLNPSRQYNINVYNFF